MPSRPTARCCRAARHVRAPLDNIWISDGVLASAFERFCTVSRLSRRQSSSVPGPLENRRRLGKKRMSGLYSADFQPTLPPWLIEYPVDLSRWKWAAPTSLEARQERAEARSASHSLLSWMDQWLPAQTDDLLVRVEQKQTAMLETRQDIEERMRTALQAVSQSRDRLHPDFVQTMGELQHEIYLGLIPIDDIHGALDQLSEFLSSGPRAEIDSASKLAAEAELVLLEAVVQGLALSRVQGLAQASPEVCETLIEKISQLPISERGVQLFHLIATAAPENCLAQAEGGIRAMLRKWLSASSTETWSTVNTLADSLSQGTISQLNRHLATLELALDQSHAKCGKAERKQRQLQCLHLLARMPHVDESQFTKACVKSGVFNGKDVHASDEAQLCELLFHQWRSRGYLHNSDVLLKTWTDTARQCPEVSLGALACRIVRRSSVLCNGNPRGLLASYFRILRRLGLVDNFRRSFGAWCASRKHLDPATFKWLATTSRDHKMAVELYQLTKQHQAKLASQRLFGWGWASWSPYVKSMILDETISPSLIWEVIHGTDGKRDSARMRKRKHELLANMAVWFSQAQHLSDRAMLRNVSRCNAWLRAEGLTVSSSGLLAVLRAVTRDLKLGKAGRTKRLTWAIELIEQNQGTEEAQRLAGVLERWRSSNAELSRIRE